MTKLMYSVGKKIEEQMVTKVCEKGKEKFAAKRVSIVSIKMIRESSILYNGRKVTSPSDAAEIGRQFLGDSDREELIVCCLDTKNQPISISVVSIGSLNSSIVHPREVDISITHRLKEAGKLIGIELIDHIIIGSEGKYCSLKEKGIL